jgi:hypothetical protein
MPSRAASRRMNDFLARARPPEHALARNVDAEGLHIARGLDGWMPRLSHNTRPSLAAGRTRRRVSPNRWCTSGH